MFHWRKTYGTCIYTPAFEKALCSALCLFYLAWNIKKRGGKLFGWCSFCLVEEFIAHWKPGNDTRHLDLDHVQEMFAVSNDLITLRKCLGQQASKVRFAPSKSWQKQRPSSDTDSMCTQNRQTLARQCISHVNVNKMPGTKSGKRNFPFLCAERWQWEKAAKSAPSFRHVYKSSTVKSKVTHGSWWAMLKHMNQAYEHAISATHQTKLPSLEQRVYVMTTRLLGHGNHFPQTIDVLVLSSSHALQLIH